jgi:hypothetical protein
MPATQPARYEKCSLVIDATSLSLPESKAGALRLLPCIIRHLLTMIVIMSQIETRVDIEQIVSPMAGRNLDVGV